MITTGTQTTEGTGNSDHPSGLKEKNHPLQEKTNEHTYYHQEADPKEALHDAQIAMTSYRGVRYECQQGVDEVHGTFCYRGHSYTK